MRQWLKNSSMYMISAPVTRKTYSVVPHKFPLAETKTDPVPADQFERYCEELTGLHDTTAAPVYVVKKIVGKRVRHGVTEYQCTWQGFSKNHKTWQPASYLTDYGAADLVRDYEKSLHHTVLVTQIMQSDEMKAVSGYV